MIKILFICHGNICRSPMAEFILKDMLQKKDLADAFFVASAATSDEEIRRGVGNPVYPPAKRILAAHGLSCEGKRAEQLKRSDYEAYDYLICMDDRNVLNARRILGGHVRDVADPWYTGDFETAYRDIAEGCEGFLQYLEGFPGCSG